MGKIQCWSSFWRMGQSLTCRWWAVDQLEGVDSQGLGLSHQVENRVGLGSKWIHLIRRWLEAKRQCFWLSRGEVIKPSYMLNSWLLTLQMSTTYDWDSALLRGERWCSKLQRDLSTLLEQVGLNIWRTDQQNDHIWEVIENGTFSVSELIQIDKMMTFPCF